MSSNALISFAKIYSQIFVSIGLTYASTETMEHGRFNFDRVCYRFVMGYFLPITFPYTILTKAYKYHNSK